MLQLRRLFVLATIVTCCLEAQGADKYTDENRPYEFGFNIDGEQHRHEKKDENGIIMGEFGFITADGVYHVTVYATDENGNFKILSMKNIRVKPYPTSPEVPSRKGNSLPFPPSQQAPITQGPAPQQPKPNQPSKSCSHCSLPTTTTPAPKLTDVAVVSRDPLPSSVLGTNPATPPKYPLAADGYQNIPQGQHNLPAQGGSPNYPHQGAAGGPNFPQRGQDSQTNYPQGPGSPQQGPNSYNSQGQGPQAGPNNPQPEQNYPQEGQNYPHPGQPGQNYPHPGQPGQNYPQPGQPGQNYPQPGQPGQNSPSGNFPQTPEQNLLPPSGQREPKQIESRFGETPGAQNNQVGPQGPRKPQLISAQMQIVDKNTDVNYKAPGEKEGLPNGLTKDDMTTLLYTFNYTVGFHGHHEEGYTNGAKKGYYYVTGRNGVRTRVDYVADENGFRPKITQEVLDLLSEDVPKPETEKDEKYGLKGYEFKWLYYPVDSKTR
ncbi:protein lethal(3)malignant blood neoplasm 1 [Cydia pomonella]|uniref:protein lethal(3)malignant blood neoplasm 1 n=1 Tax=Cydia pomonella TaxID=82600 RepID=UPI002ADD8A9F|nr:protein lethal(3)malignant blood neoplasm 1 [Cydia pomonella]